MVVIFLRSSCFYDFVFWREYCLHAYHEYTARHNQSPALILGVLLSEAEVKRAAAVCQAAGCWLVFDNTYEHFIYGGKHICVPGDNVLHIFSFSKVCRSRLDPFVLYLG